MKKSIALYCRVSSDKQAKEKTIESQVSALRDYANENDLFVEEDLIFTDKGISGASFVRPALDALRDKVLEGEVSTVLILCPDRLARKYAHQLILIEEFQRLGVEIIFSNKTISTSPEDQMLLQIQGVISEYEREKLLERCRRGKLYKAKRGSVNVLSGAPYGYVYVPKGEVHEGVYKIHPEESQVVKKIFQMYSYDKLSIGSIASRLRGENIRTRTQLENWGRSTICGILKNPAYYGQAGFRKRKTVERCRSNKLSIERSSYPKRAKSSHSWRDKKDWVYISVPAIIDMKTFEMAAAQFDENKRFSLRNNKRFNYLLSGLLRCSVCGYSLRGYSCSKGGRTYSYYRCISTSSPWLNKSRFCLSTRVEVLDDLIWDRVVKLIEQPETVVNEYLNRIDSQKNNHESLKVMIQKKDKEIHRVEKEKVRLLDIYQVGSLSLSELEPRLQRLHVRINNFEMERNSLKQEQAQGRQQLQLIDTLDEFKKKVGKGLTELTFKQKKEIVRLLVQEVIVNIKTGEAKVRHIVPELKSLSLCTSRQ